jgi:hypothetical protein
MQKNKIVFIFLALLTLQHIDLNGAMSKYETPSFKIDDVKPGKIFTPNVVNLHIEIRYYDPYGSAVVNGKIYNIPGALISDMDKDYITGNPEWDGTLKWDGNDSNGNPAPMGVYIYQIEVTGPENKIISGTIVLIR